MIDGIAPSICDHAPRRSVLDVNSRVHARTRACVRSQQVARLQDRDIDECCRGLFPEGAKCQFATRNETRTPSTSARERTKLNPQTNSTRACKHDACSTCRSRCRFAPAERSVRSSGRDCRCLLVRESHSCLIAACLNRGSSSSSSFLVRSLCIQGSSLRCAAVLVKSGHLESREERARGVGHEARGLPARVHADAEARRAVLGARVNRANVEHAHVARLKRRRAPRCAVSESRRGVIRWQLDFRLLPIAVASQSPRSQPQQLTRPYTDAS